MKIKVADQLVETLVKTGVKRIYAVSGDGLNIINEAVHKNGKIQWIHVRHQETAAFAASAEAQLTGNIACCAGSSGPGHIHLINGLYDSHRSGASALAIASTVFSEEFGTGYFQETNTIKLFDDCSYYNGLATTPSQFPKILQGAIQAAISLKGVSVMAFPSDLASKEAVINPTSSLPFITKPTVCPSIEEIRDLAQLLNSKKNITLFCGIGAKDAHAEIIELSKKLCAPVVYTFKSKMEIQYDNPNEVGMTGLLGMPSGYYSMQEADVLLMLGTDFPYAAFMPKNKKIVQIDIKQERLGRRAKLSMGLCGDVKTSLQNLLPYIVQKTDDTFLNDRLDQYDMVKQDLLTYVENKGKENQIHPEFIMHTVNKLAKKDAIFTVDTGMTCVWGARYLQATRQRHMLGSFNHGSMANALPQSIGASLAYPDKQVIALCGDGGLSMLLGELATVAQYKLPIKIIVFNNKALGMVKLEMEVAGIPDRQADMLNPDFALVAKAMGINSYTVIKPEDVETILAASLNSKESVLVNIMIDSNALAMPPKVRFGQVAGFAQAMYKMLLEGRKTDVINAINANYKHLREII